MTLNANQSSIDAFSAHGQELMERCGDEGDTARRYLFNLVLYDMFGSVQGRWFLDAGCGTGYLCRLLARLGASVVGVEPAQALYDYAAQREHDDRLGNTYTLQDLSLLVGYHTS